MASSRARYLSSLADTLNSSGQVTSDNILLPNSGVTAGSYGSASAIPVLTIDATGRVTSATTSAVAGVSSFTYNTATAVLTIGTASGSTFPATITLAPFSTTNLTEGGNLYYTDARARAALGYVTGTAAYNSVTGVYTIPSTSSHITEGTNLFYTDARARAALSAGTGVTYNSTTGAISIGQAVGTTNDVTFNSVTVNGTLSSDDITSTNITASGNLTVSGNLIVSGTTTTLNSTTLAIADINIELAKNATTAAMANGAGITIDGAAATLTYTSADDRWNFNKNLNVGTVYGNVVGAVTGNASTASALQTVRSFTTTGDASWTVNFDGSANVSAALTLANSGVIAGSYGSGTAIPVLTIDAKGRITSATTSAVTIGDGTMTVTAGTGLTGGGQLGTANQTGASSVTISHATSGVTAGTYNNVTVNTLGHVTSGSNVAYLTSESDTLATVTARGSSTSTTVQLNGGLTSTSGSPIQLYALGSGTYNIGVMYINSTTFGFEAPITTDSSTGTKVPFYLTWRGGYATQGGLKLTGGSSAELGGYTIWHAGNLTNLNQLSNGPGYITGESDTLATVTGRGATTSTAITINNALTVAGAINHSGGFAYLGNWNSGPSAGHSIPSNYSGTAFSWNLSDGSAEANIWNTTNPATYTGTGLRFLQWLTSTTYRDLMFLRQDGALSFGGVGNIGSSGQVLQSNGAAAPTWVSLSYLPLSGGTLTGRTIVNVTGRSFTVGGSPGGAPASTIASQTSFLEIAAGSGGNTNSAGVIFHNPNVSTSVLEYVNTTADNGYFNLRSDDLTYDARVNSNTILHAGNYTSYSPSLTGSGASGTWGISITGGAASLSNFTAAYSANPITPDSPPTMDAIGYCNSISLFGQGDGGLYSAGYSTSWYHQIFGDFRTGQIAIRGKNSGTWQSWRTVLDSGNYSSYALPLSGGTMSGTIGSSRNDLQRLFESYNTSAGGPVQFFIDHSYGDVNIGNARGALKIQGSVALHAGNYTSYTNPTSSNDVYPGTAYAYTHGYIGGDSTQDFNATVLQGQSSAASINATSNTPFGSAWYNMLNVRHRGGSGDGYAWGGQLVWGMTSYQNRLAFRVNNGSATSWSSWTEALTSANYSSYALPLSGGSLSTGATNNLFIGRNSTATAYNAISLNGNSADSSNMGLTGGGGTDQTLYINSPGNVWIRTNSFGQATVFSSSGITWAGNQVLHASNYGNYAPSRSEFRNFGSIVINPAGYNTTCTTAQFISHLTSLGFFNYSSAVGKCTWDYAGNNDLTDTGFGTVDMAGCVIETFWDGTYKHVRVTRPTTGAGNFQVLVYNDQGSGYSPGWRRYLTSDGGLVLGDGYIDFGPNSTWAKTLRVGGNGNNDTSRASVVTTNGNLHLDGGSGGGVYLNYYNNGPVYATANNYTVLHSGNYTSYAINRGGDTVDSAIYFRSNKGASSYVGANNTYTLEAYASDGGAAGMSFHRAGYYAINMGLDPDNVFRIGGWSASANRLQMDMSGNLTMAGNVTAYSDERLKKDWNSISSDYLTELANIKHGSYTRIDSEERQVGVSAQDLQKILPEAISTDNEGYLSVAYGNAALVSAVELAKKVVEQEERIKRLESLVETLINKLGE